MKSYIEKVDGRVLAVFPDEQCTHNSDDIVCYAPIGQRSRCSKEYLRTKCRRATPEEYDGLKSELESIGYQLSLVK